MSALIARYSAELSLSEDVTANTIEKLRVHAIEKLAARNKLRQTSKATFKVKLAGHVPLEVRCSRSLSVKLINQGSDNENLTILLLNISLVCFIAPLKLTFADSLAIEVTTCLIDTLCSEQNVLVPVGWCFKN